MASSKEICKLCDSPLGDYGGGVCLRCQADPFPNDTLLRKRGWQINSRKTGHPALWRRVSDGKLCTYKEALKEKV